MEFLCVWGGGGRGVDIGIRGFLCVWRGGGIRIRGIPVCHSGIPVCHVWNSCVSYLEFHESHPIQNVFNVVCIEGDSDVVRHPLAAGATSFVNSFTVYLTRFRNV